MNTQVMVSVTRRDMLMGAAATATMLSSPARGAGQRQRTHPNIMWLVSEDNNPFIGAYGDTLAQTPALDALAARGVLYENAYSNAPVCALSRFAILTGISPESCGPAHHMRAQAQLPAGFRTYPELMREAGYYCTNNAKTDYNCMIDSAALWDEQGRHAHWQNRPAGKPFLAVFNYETTHESQIFRPTAEGVTSDQVNLPPYLPDTPDIRQDFASYYNRMAILDAQIDARLKELKDAGLSDDTIVFYYSDNGGVLPRSKRYCYQEGLHCPLIVHVPDKWQHLAPAKPGSRIADPVTFLDLAPTLLSIVDQAAPAQMQGRALFGHRRSNPVRYAFGGRNRMDERYDFIRTVTDGRWRYIRNYMPHRPWGQHQAFEWLAKGYQSWEDAYLTGSLTPTQSRFFEEKPFEELYDLRQDPHEVRNLAEDPAAAQARQRLSDALDTHILTVNDNGFIPEGMAGEGYFESRDKKTYPLAEIMALAAIAAQRNASSATLLAGALAHSNAMMRYWAAAGLRMIGQAAAQHGDALRLRANEDAFPHVRLMAAEALAATRDDDDGWSVLARFLSPETDWRLQLQAINAITFIEGSRDAVLPDLQRLQSDEVTYVKSAARYLVAKLTGQYRPDLPIFDMQGIMKGFER